MNELMHARCRSRILEDGTLQNEVVTTRRQKIRKGVLIFDFIRLRYEFDFWVDFYYFRCDGHDKVRLSFDKLLRPSEFAMNFVFCVARIFSNDKIKKSQV